MRIIIVEDDEALAGMVKKLLEYRGFTVDWLSSGEKARTRILLYRNDYSLILLDLNLPDISGAELTKGIRVEGVTTPIIILTGESRTEHKIALLESGADDFVVKPFFIEELVARINAILRRPLRSEPVVHSLGAIEMHTATRRVLADGVEIPLSLKEYALLECFLRRPNEVLTREDLSNQVWDFNSLTHSNVLDVHMKNLRKKLQRARNAAHFETVRGVGYRLTSPASHAGM